MSHRLASQTHPHPPPRKILLTNRKHGEIGSHMLSVVLYIFRDSRNKKVYDYVQVRMQNTKQKT